MDALFAAIELAPAQALFAAVMVFLAGAVRGFAGFALSALVMASVIGVLPPVELIPVCYVLEVTASLMMFRGGARQADWSVVWGLVIGSTLGTPLGLYTTIHVSADTSRTIALFLILLLAALQLRRVAPTFLATKSGLYLSGLLAGIATGLAHIGGMVVALYVLAQHAPPARMRASLVMYLFIGVFTQAAWFLTTGVLDQLAFSRGVVLAPVAAAGVWLGSMLFRPALLPYYRLFCLLLLSTLAVAGLVRQFA